MKYYKYLYIGESVGPKEKKIIRMLNKGHPLLNVYLIVLAHHENNHLEIFDSALLGQKVFRKEEQFIVGIANGREEAFNLVEKITQEAYNETGTSNIRQFILDRELES